MTVHASVTACSTRQTGPTRHSPATAPSSYIVQVTDAAPKVRSLKRLPNELIPYRVSFMPN